MPPIMAFLVGVTVGVVLTFALTEIIDVLSKRRKWIPLNPKDKRWHR